MSSDEQADPNKESLPEQKRLNAEFIESLSTYYPDAKGILVGELTVVGSRSIILFSEAVETYDAYRQLRDMIAERRFDVLVCRKRDRLGRKEALIIAIESLCEEAGIVIAARDSLPPTLDRKLLSANEGQRIVNMLHSHRAAEEIREIQRRHREGMLARAKRGQFPAAVPYGWKRVYAPDGSSHIEIDPEAAEAVRYVFDTYVHKGQSINDIRRELERRGYGTPRGGPWSHTGILVLLDRVWSYAGYLEYNKQSKTGRPLIRTEGDWPAIISEELAEAVVKERESRANSRRSVRSNRLFSRVARCGRCDAPINVQGNFTSDGDLVYRCHQRCRGGYVVEKRMKSALQAAIEFLSVQANLDAVLEQMPDERSALGESVQHAEEELNSVGEQRLRLTRAYMAGALQEREYIKLMRESEQRQSALADRLSDLRRQLEAAENEDQRKLRLQNVAASGHKMLNHPDINVANAWIRRHFRLYILDNDVDRIVYL